MVALIDTPACSTWELLFAPYSHLPLAFNKLSYSDGHIGIQCSFTVYFSNNNEVEVEDYFICLFEPSGYSVFRCACSNLLLILLLIIRLFKKLICRHSFYILDKALRWKCVASIFPHTLVCFYTFSCCLFRKFLNSKIVKYIIAIFPPYYFWFLVYLV